MHCTCRQTFFHWLFCSYFQFVSDRYSSCISSLVARCIFSAGNWIFEQHWQLPCRQPLAALPALLLSQYKRELTAWQFDISLQKSALVTVCCVAGAATPPTYQLAVSLALFTCLCLSVCLFFLSFNLCLLNTWLSELNLRIVVKQ